MSEIDCGLNADGRAIYWRWRQERKGWQYAKVRADKTCPSLITLVHEDEISEITHFIVADPNDIDWREAKQ